MLTLSFGQSFVLAEPVRQDGDISKDQSIEFTKDDFEYGVAWDEELRKEVCKIIGLNESGNEKLKKNKNVNIPERINEKKVEVIGKYAFKSKNLASVSLPSTLLEVEDGAFAGNSIKILNLPSALNIIEQNAFCYNDIENILITEKVKKIELKAFGGNPIKKVEIDNYKGSVSIGAEAFDYFKVKYLRAKDDSGAGTWLSEDFTFEDWRFKPTGLDEVLTLKAVTGLSEKGKNKLEKNKDLVLPNVGTDGKKVEAVEKGAFQGKLSVKRLDSLTISEGYRVIGSMAFAFNGCGGEPLLPDSMEFVDFGAFFRNEFTSLTVPAKITDIPLSMMRGNKLKKINFKGNVETIGRLAFAENSIEEIVVPDSLKSIGEQAFTTNVGSDKYDGKVVIRTSSGSNPNKLKDKENYLIDPKKPGSNPSINYKEWTVEDFDYDGSKGTGFSEQGRKKIRKNKKLVIPEKTKSGLPVEVIGIDAFRNLNKGYDIVSVKLPDTVTEIEDYAFQFNDITDFKMPRDLKKLGMGVFMMAGVNHIEWNNKIEYIDQACFYMCELGKLEAPASVETIMNAAFRNCSLTEIKFAKGSKLKSIASLAFADNKLSKMDLPEGIERIGSQAFGNNKFKELNVPNSLKEIGFQAFLGNPDEKNPAPVKIHTVSAKNPNGLTDDAGKSFVIDPEVKADATDFDMLKKAVEEADKIDTKKLTKGFDDFFKNVLKDAKECLKDKSSSKSKVRGLAKETAWATERAALSALVHEKETLEPNKDKYDADKVESCRRCL